MGQVVNGVKRFTGEPGAAGEFIVQDRNGIEWKVIVIPSKKGHGRWTCARPVICWSANYECQMDLEGDFFDAAIRAVEEGK